jgi:hypothetical protein
LGFRYNGHIEHALCFRYSGDIEHALFQI